MRMINGKPADELRKRFIDAFVNKAGEYYRSAIRETRLCPEGMCYTGRLGECLKEPEEIAFAEAMEYIRSRGKVCALRDLNRTGGTPAADRCGYPKRAVLLIDRSELEAVLSALPDDVYFFDDSFTWAAALMREQGEGEKRRCLRCVN